MYNGTKVLDIHAHVSAPSGNGMLVMGAMLASNSPIWTDPRGSGLEARGFTEEAWAGRVKTHTDLLESHSIEAQLVGPRPFTMLGWMQPHIMKAWSRFTNHMIAKQCEMEPTRYVGAAMLPQQPKADDLSHCLEELEYCVNELGFKGCYLSPDPAGDRSSPGMDQPYWDPIYEYCQKNGLVIIVHGTNCVDPRIRTIPQNYQIGFVWEQYLATQLLSHGDVFERFPELKVVVCHCGGALDRFIKTDKHLAQKDLSNNLYFDTCALDLDFLEAAIKQRTPHNTLFGTETPGSGAAVRPETGLPGDDLVPVIGAMDFLSEDDKVAIFHGNAAHICPGLAAITA
ncbi:MAG: amidohydrolase family protein [Rhodospirillales bacterium]|jgi:predicted TIM-barrel fold metal-dependent hydrolase